MVIDNGVKMNRYQASKVNFSYYIKEDINHFKQLLNNHLGNLKGKFVYELHFNEELCKLTGRIYSIPVYIGGTSDLCDRFYRHFKGLYPSFNYVPNMEKGRAIYNLVKNSNVHDDVLNTLGNYIFGIVHDYTDSNIELDNAEGEKIKKHKLLYGVIPMFNEREEKVAFGNQTKVRKFFNFSSLANTGVRL